MTNATRSFDTPDPILIEINNKAGDVQLDLTDTTTTTVEFSVATDLPLPWLQEIWGTFGGGRAPFDQPAVDRAIADFTTNTGAGGRRGRLNVDTRPAVSGWQSRINVHITAPQSSEVRLTGQATDLRVAGTSGPLTVRTASGDITVDNCDADARLNTASGDVVIGPVAGAAMVRTVSGDVQMRSVGGRAIVQSTSGNVRLGPVSGDLVVRTVSGDVTAAEVFRAAARVATVSGDVDLALRHGAVASLGLSSMTGQIRSDLTVEQGPPAPPQHESERGPRRRADVDIRVKTVSGNIRLRRTADAGTDAPASVADVR